ncbi:MAG: thiamine-phosphate kinase [Pseudomonadota bacterium]
MHESTWIERYIVPLVSAPGADRLRDDVAVLSTSGIMIATMDTLVEGVHFLPDDPLDTVGRKLVRVNVSDIYAKGAKPVEALLSIAWPRGRDETEFASLLSGLKIDLESYDLALLGGDLVATEGPLTLTLSLTGQCFGPQPVRRSGGRPGHAVFVNGEIGWGGAGLAAAKTQTDLDVAARYRLPQISTEADARTVATQARASMDVSDGLLIDASRLAKASECGVELDLSLVPLAKPTEIIEQITAQCASGDDYCLLISADANQTIRGFSKIGKLTQTPGLRLSYGGKDINLPSTLGFEHEG